MASTARAHADHEDQEPKNKPRCVTDNCWEEAVCAGMCKACYEGFRRLRDLEMPDFTKYLKKIRRIGARAAAYSGGIEFGRRAEKTAHNRKRGHIRAAR